MCARTSDVLALVLTCHTKGFYYDAQSGYYYNATTGYSYHPTTQAYYSFDPTTQALVAVAAEVALAALPLPTPATTTTAEAGASASGTDAGTTATQYTPRTSISGTVCLVNTHTSLQHLERRRKRPRRRRSERPRLSGIKRWGRSWSAG
jgi:imidazolonepropionase-like amidohydrolase